MIVLWLLTIGSLIVLPCSALLALRWAVHHGEFRHLQKTALLIFDDEEPVGRMTDHFPASPSTQSNPPADRIACLCRHGRQVRAPAARKNPVQRARLSDITPP